ncbi:hypothetical protein ACB094_10G057600 [Castanea mollissima]
MAKAMLHILLHALWLAALLMSCHGQERKVHWTLCYVYMGEKPQGDFSVASTHHSMLERLLGKSERVFILRCINRNQIVILGMMEIDTQNSDRQSKQLFGEKFRLSCQVTSTAKESLIYSYGKSFNGFAEKLTDEETAKFLEMEVSVLPNQILELHATRSWDFMGFPSKGKVGRIWPESDSFNDGLSSPPSRWKSKCQGANFTCNNKIIGARYYNSEGFYGITDIKSPRDSEGHGTHTSSTAAGREVAGASYFGLAEGTARGGVPGARIEMYKVCCNGVDIISMSLGFIGFPPYFRQPIAIGSFHAMRKDILTSATIDRKLVAQVVLGNGQVYTGIAINSFNLNGTPLPLIWGGDATNYSADADPDISKYCNDGTMNSYKVQGKIVFCEGVFDSSGILLANAVGIIMAHSPITDVAHSFPLPATIISVGDGLTILNYIRSTEVMDEETTILAGETWKDVMAPNVVSFSSRGPDPIALDILKPNLTAPRVDILAAWSPVAPPSMDQDDTRSVKFNIISGTSMSCPYTSGVTAYVKAAHPNWSLAAIKSTLMTTSEINFPCMHGYNTIMLRLIIGDNSNFCNTSKPGRAWNLNYPSFFVVVEDGQQILAIFTRTVTNVDPPNSTYTLSTYIQASIDVTMEPFVLSFSAIGEKKSFIVQVYGPKIALLGSKYLGTNPIISGAITWKYGHYMVRSSLVVYIILPGTLYPSASMSQKKANFQGSSMYHKNGILKHKY